MSLSATASRKLLCTSDGNSDKREAKCHATCKKKKQDVISDYVGPRSFRILITPSKYHWFRCDGAWGWGCGVWGEGWEEGYKTTRTTTTSQRRIAVGPLSCVNNNTSDPVLHKISVIFFMQSCYWWAHIVPSVFVAAQGSQDFSWNPISFSVFLYDPKLTQQWFVMIQGSAQEDHWWSQGRCEAWMILDDPSHPKDLWQSQVPPNSVRGDHKLRAKWYLITVIISSLPKQWPKLTHRGGPWLPRKWLGYGKFVGVVEVVWFG